jgi:hypothetical protein
MMFAPEGVGRGAETVVNLDIRKSWELLPSQFELSFPTPAQLGKKVYFLASLCSLSFPLCPLLPASLSVLLRIKSTCTKT